MAWKTIIINRNIMKFDKEKNPFRHHEVIGYSCRFSSGVREKRNAGKTTLWKSVASRKAKRMKAARMSDRRFSCMKEKLSSSPILICSISFNRGPNFHFSPSIHTRKILKALFCSGNFWDGNLAISPLLKSHLLRIFVPIRNVLWDVRFVSFNENDVSNLNGFLWIVSRIK